MIKWLALVAIAVVAIGVASPWLARHGLGRLPGDIVVKWRGRRIYLPITTTVLLSAALTLLARLVKL